MTMQRQREELVKAGRLARFYWQKACEHDGIHPNDLFVVFSPGNPWVELQQRAIGVLQAHMRRYNAVAC